MTRLRRSRFATPMLLLVVLVAVGTLYAALGGSGRASAAQATDTSTVAQGRELFVNGCSTCHGINAQGGSYGPSLDRRGCRRCELPGRHGPHAARPARCAGHPTGPAVHP